MPVRVRPAIAQPPLVVVHRLPLVRSHACTGLSQYSFSIEQPASYVIQSAKNASSRICRSAASPGVGERRQQRRRRLGRPAHAVGVARVVVLAVVQDRLVAVAVLGLDQIAAHLRRPVEDRGDPVARVGAVHAPVGVREAVLDRVRGAPGEEVEAGHRDLRLADERQVFRLQRPLVGVDHAGRRIQRRQRLPVERRDRRRGRRRARACRPARRRRRSPRAGSATPDRRGRCGRSTACRSRSWARPANRASACR